MNGRRSVRGLIGLFALMAIMPLALAANGYGTSSISVSQSTVAIGQGSSINVNYSVNLATGNTWGTNLVIVNETALAAQGITVTISKSYGDPTYSGYLIISASSTATQGSHDLVLQATGDDPSTSNTTIVVNVVKMLITTTNQTNATTTAVASSVATTSVPPATTTTAQNTGGGQNNGYTTTASNQAGGLALELGAWILLILIIAAFCLMKMNGLSTKLDIIGIALILIGTGVWLYGDYSGGLMTYIWAGVAAILLGTLVWIIGNWKAGAFVMKK